MKLMFKKNNHFLNIYHALIERFNPKLGIVIVCKLEKTFFNIKKKLQKAFLQTSFSSAFYSRFHILHHIFYFIYVTFTRNYQSLAKISKILNFYGCTEFCNELSADELNITYFLSSQSEGGILTRAHYDLLLFFNILN